MKELKSQYQAIQASAGWFELKEEEIFEVTGRGAEEFLSGYNTQDIKSLKVHQACLGAFLTQKGKLVSDSLIFKLPEKFILFLNSGYGAKLLKHLEIYLSFAEAELKDGSAQWAHFLLLGPQAEVVLSQIKTSSGVYQFSSDRFGASGWEILCPQDQKDTILETLKSSDAVALNLEVLEVLRVEAGLPKMGVDMDENNLVAEVGLDQRATSFNKGCYLGQEPTARINTRGHVNKKLVQFVVEQVPTSDLPLDILCENKLVGRLTSVVESIKFQRRIGLGVVSCKVLEEKRPLKVNEIPLSPNISY